MFDNILYQEVTKTLASNIQELTLPPALLFCGKRYSGKLSCALELARVLSCTEGKGAWNCSCPSCKKHKALTCDNVLLLGTCDCLYEIKASIKTLCFVIENSQEGLNATVSFFVRAVRKLLMRFSPVLWETDEKLSKFSSILENINDLIEDFENKTSFDAQTVQKKCDKIEKLCEKLQDSFMYISIPVLQVRNASAWVHSTSTNKKIVIIQNADCMQDSARNSMLKILEEPPSDTFFILTATKKSNILPTILSRVRVYNFRERSSLEQAQLIKRIFHNITNEGIANENTTIEDLLLSYSNVQLSVVENKAHDFFQAATNTDANFNDNFPSIEALIKECGGFTSANIRNIFLTKLLYEAKKIAQKDARLCHMGLEIAQMINTSYIAQNIYNQSPTPMLEALWQNIINITQKHQG